MNDAAAVEDVSAFRNFEGEEIAPHITEAIAAGELRPDVDARAVAAILISSLEGAIITTSLLREPRQMAATAAHLREWLSGMLTTGRVHSR